MQFRVSLSAGSILNYPEKSYPEIDLFFHSLVEKITIPKGLNDWTIECSLVTKGGSSIQVLKRGITYAKTKEKLVSVGLPIPRKSAVQWGIDDNRFLDAPELDSKYFTSIEFNPDDYNTLDEYIVACAKKTIIELFAEGITLKNKKIKLAR